SRLGRCSRGIASKHSAVARALGLPAIHGVGLVEAWFSAVCGESLAVAEGRGRACWRRVSRRRAVCGKARCRYLAAASAIANDAEDVALSRSGGVYDFLGRDLLASVAE